MNVLGKKSKLNLAIVGCGRISRNHIHAIVKEHQRVRLAALCDKSKQRLSEAKGYLAEASKEFNLKTSSPKEFNCINDLISAKKNGELEIDLVILATPSGLHASQTILCANENINVCTEKPMAVKLIEGKEMIKICDKNSVKLFVILQIRLNKTISLLKKQIENGRFGRIFLININVFWQRPQEYYDQSSWRGTWEFDGGALMNQASHYVDLLDWLIGPVENVNACISSAGRNIEVDDTCVMNIKWRNGALGSMSVTILTYPKNLEGSITILGEKGSVKIGGKSVDEIEWWEFKDSSNEDKKVEEIKKEIAKNKFFGHSAYYEQMIDCLEGKETDITTGRDGFKSLELIIAAYRSARDKVNVGLPLDL